MIVPHVTGLTRLIVELDFISFFSLSLLGEQFDYLVLFLRFSSPSIVEHDFVSVLSLLAR